jgi:zinc protease
MSWPHEGSDIKPDPAVRYGILANGMRYAIMRNAQPAQAVSLRLRIATGALQETDSQRGLAHFLEHMAFNGSRNVPEGEFIKLLQRKGLQFGPHTNAFTSTFETVYQLELPRNDADLIDTGFMLFREIGDRLTLDAKAIEDEKGVVLAELRGTHVAEYRAFHARWTTSLEGQRAAERLPHGTEATIKGATKALIADYYTRYYRPERTVLVAVGDFDPAAIEAKIKAKFSDWTGKGPASIDPDRGSVKNRGLVVKTHIETNLPEQVTVSWFQPPENATDTVAARARNVTRALAVEIINRRFERMTRQPSAPFMSANISFGEIRHTLREVALSIGARPGQWRGALAAGEQELRRALLHGVHQSEVDRGIKAIRAALKDGIAQASTRSTSTLANALASQFQTRSVFNHPSDTLKVFESFAPKLTPAAVQAALRDMIKGEGPVIVVSSGLAIEGGEKTVAAAYQTSLATPVTAGKQDEVKNFPYSDFGKAGTIANRADVKDLGLTTLSFANGVKLNVKPTTFEKDTIYVAVAVAGGFLQLPRTKPGLQWLVPGAFIQGGLKRLTAEELQDALVGRVANNEFDLHEDVFMFSGRTNKEDLDFQLQLMTAFLSDPGYRAIGLSLRQDAAEDQIRALASDPGGVLSREEDAIVRSGDARWMSPTIAQMRAIKVADIEAAMQPALANAPIEVTIVGDVTVEAAVKAVAGTLGALKARAAKGTEPAGARNLRFPSKGAVHRFTHDGSKDKALGYAAWPAPDFYSDTRRVRAIAILAEMMKLRLLEEFREVQGATYTPQTGKWHSEAFGDFGYIAASAETKPDLVDAFYKTIDDIVAELKAGKFNDDLIARARTPLVEASESGRRGNGYWFGALTAAQSEPRSLDAIRSRVSELKAITRAELVAVAQKYLDNTRRVDIRVLPK